MATTPTYALRYPVLGDTPNGPAAFQNLATDVETELKAPFGHAGVTSGFAAAAGPNGAYPTLAAQVLLNGMTFSSNGLVVPKTGYYRISAKGYFTGSSNYQGVFGVTINSTATPPAGAALAFGLGLLHKPNSSDFTDFYSVIRQLTVNDRLRLHVNAGTTGGQTYGTTGYDGAWLEALYVGK